ncbi:MAG: hypothetical protein SOV24_07115 [Muribaculaceae bacterium]|nr:hypothetical protein [Bacteroidales bacterium]MDY2734110.1 hypothetical protein [Muribaculaceae bacterium]
MERAAASYAKYNRVDLEDEQTLPYELIVVQPFTATDDPTVLGIKPIPNIQPRQISDMIAKYRAETLDTMLNSVTRWIFPFGKPTAKYFTCIIASRSATIFMPVLAILNCLRRGKSAKSEIVASFP